ncbi:LuxR C-terminal-related transcriptional regulator [Roseofilum sp. BLCC_M91]|uniref:LuxR C-terminal-related transcriptional regulator n=1 Tax=Roseofilum halophilum BLCC-M91 TaxID=3022259 RepID=A0ABT7BJD3_9CYAN|nr:LuxR C-terminal-related transcriptional regulator [Roseofilum halophilum]MDJ1178388.1 LuxR C-terminal-related transcriptional regulator [Roseofilum halophilum BLCC-M91]
MNQEEFEQVYGELTPRRQQVLHGILSGEADAQIAHQLGISEAAIRKHVERIVDQFGLANSQSQNGQRRSKRSDLVSLVARYKPELLKMPLPVQNEEEDSLLELLQDIQPIQSIHDNLEPKLQLWQESSDSSQKKQIGDRLKKTGYDTYMQGDFPGTVFYLQWALKFQIDSPAIRYNLASAYEKLSDFPNAYHHYNLAAQADTHAAHAAISNLSRLDILSHNPDRAIDRITPILDQVKDRAVLSTLYKNLGWAYLLKKDLPQAERWLRQAIELNSDRAAPHCLLAQVLQAQEKPLEATPYWQKCLDCDTHQARSINSPWRSPELDLWQLEARQHLGTNLDSKTLTQGLHTDSEPISLPH